MKYFFGKTSNEQLKTLDIKLVILLSYAIGTSPVDFTVKEGYRAKDLQNKYFREGKSKLKFPESTHNLLPSLGVDLYPVSGKVEDFFILSTHIKQCSKVLRIPIEWGGDWKSFKDLPHYQLVR